MEGWHRASSFIPPTHLVVAEGHSYCNRFHTGWWCAGQLASLARGQCSGRATHYFLGREQCLVRYHWTSDITAAGKCIGTNLVSGKQTRFSVWIHPCAWTWTTTICCLALAVKALLIRLYLWRFLEKRLNNRKTFFLQIRA